MKLMIQIKTTHEEAEKFIRQITKQGYEAHREEDAYRGSVYFTVDGEVTIDYEVGFFDEDVAYIGVRPQ
jgi:hypothetical protein